MQNADYRGNNKGDKIMKRYEISISIIDKNYVDNLIVALVRQGYAVYYSKDEKSVCFEVREEDDLREIKV